MKNYKIIFGLLVAVILVAPAIVLAQPPLPQPVAAPLDGGISIAILAGAGLAVKRIWKKK
jgi:hypothetical protein